MLSEIRDIVAKNGTKEPDHAYSISLKTADYSENKSLLVNLIKSLRDVIGKLDCLEYPSDDSKLNILKLLHVQDVLDTRSTGKMLKSKLADSLQYLEKLLFRINDTKSRVLVTGDLNAGKSTFVNAMLKRNIVPDDQQPCTNLFAEVIDADQNDGIEEVHALRDISLYDRNDSSTFDRLDLRELRSHVEDNVENYALLKVYCKDHRDQSQSLLHNGVIDISLIDSPGLNIDTMKTSALFAQQEEIDVVVFVVNAENHFTLSGKEFLELAGKEKTYIFIVVNKFDLIRRKEKCREEILNQISRISPQTYKDKENLVHFVSAKNCLPDSTENSAFTEFSALEDSLRSFVLEKRARSKLLPAKVYVQHLLQDLLFILDYNITENSKVSENIQGSLAATSPKYESMMQVKTQIVDMLDEILDKTIAEISSKTQTTMTSFIRNLDMYLYRVPFPGLFSIQQYSQSIKGLVKDLIKLKVDQCRQFASERALAVVTDIEEHVIESMPDLRLEKVLTLTPAELPISFGGTSFESTNALLIFRKFIAPGSIFVVGSIGFYLTRNILAPRAIFTSVSLFGLGLAGFEIISMPRYLSIRILDGIRENIKSVNFVATSDDAIARETRSAIRNVLVPYLREFESKMDSILKIRNNMIHDVREAELKMRELGDVQRKCRVLDQKLVAIVIDE